MTGWDTPSRPTWDPQDGPDDGTQAFSIPDTSVGADDPWAASVGSEWGAPDYGGPDSAGRDLGGRDLGGRDLGGRDLGGRDLGGRDLGGRAAGGPDFGASGSDDPFSGPPPEFFKQEFDQRTPGATLGGAVGMPSWDLPVRDGNGRGRQAAPGVLGGRGGDGAGAPAPAWDAPQWQEAPRQDLTHQDFDRQDFDRQDLNRQESARQESARRDFDRLDFDGQGPARQSSPRRKPARGANRADYAPPSGATDYAAQPGRANRADYAPPQGGADYVSAPDQADQAPTGTAHPEWESAAMSDPALQDFFAPTTPGSGYPKRPDQAAVGYRSHRTQSPGLPGSGSYNGHGGRDAGKPSGGGRNRFIAVGVVVVVVVAGGAYLLLHKPSNSNDANAGAPTVTASTPAHPTSTGAAKPTAKASTKPSPLTSSAPATGRYVLSTPPTAGPYPMGQDPHFLATTTTTATSIEQLAVSHSGGTMAGSPVSASYRLPSEQTIEFVGYQGTFNPKTVMANLGSFGTGENTYNAGPNGGLMSCANVPATMTATSGAVCVWVTTSTLGVAEFFDISGPEVLTVDQFKGAADTLKLRSSVETHKS